MTLSLTLFVAAILFFAGLRLSAFFSGSETGFYRVSTLQLTLGKQRGDNVATRLFFFATHPERFVATTLVGNNVANYLTTLAIGMIVAAVWHSSSGAPEIIATLLLTPVVFVFGELIPKSLYYRAPMSLLRSGAVGFMACYYLFLPISYPLILLSRFISSRGTSEKRPLEVIFGRTRLYGVLEAGQREGILTELQRNLAENLMQVADQAVELSMIPASTVYGIPESLSVDEALAVAKRTKSPYLLIHRDNDRREWFAALRIADMLTTNLAPRHTMKKLPVFDVATPRLEALTEMMKVGAMFGVVKDDGRGAGIISRQVLVSQLFRRIRLAAEKNESAPHENPIGMQGSQ